MLDQCQRILWQSMTKKLKISTIVNIHANFGFSIILKNFWVTETDGWRGKIHNETMLHGIS